MISAMTKHKEIDPVNQMHQGKRIRTTRTKTMKDYHVRNKERPPVNPEDKCAGYFFIKPQSVEVMKRLVTEKASSRERLIHYCEEQARFQYFYTVQNVSFAQNHAKKKPPVQRLMFCCQLCDEHFTTERKLMEHERTNTHFEMSMLFECLIEVFNEWYEAIIDPIYSLSSTAVQAEVEGIKVMTGKVSSSFGDINVCEHIKQHGGKQRELQEDIVTLHGRRWEEIFSAPNAGNLPLEPFILMCYEQVMEAYWPTPSTQYYCRCCNHEAFETEEMLNRHKETDEHERRQSTFLEAWCVTCQIHAGNAMGYSAHLNTLRHKTIKRMLDDTKKKAIEFWNKLNNLDLVPQSKAQPLPYSGRRSRGELESDQYPKTRTKECLPSSRCSLSDRSMNIPKSNHNYQPDRIKRKVYLADGRRKLPKSKLIRDIRRMEKYNAKKEALAAAALAAGGSSDE